LLIRNVPSRETNDSMRCDEATRCARVEKRVNDPTRTRTRNPSNAGPIADCVNEWTELMVPDRVRNVPRIVREKALMTNTKFQAWSMLRRC